MIIKTTFVPSINIAPLITIDLKSPPSTLGLKLNSGIQSNRSKPYVSQLRLQTTTASSISFQVYSGSYYYQASAGGYTLSPGNGWVTASGSNQVVNLQAQLGYIWFTPVGLNPGVQFHTEGTRWSLQINGWEWGNWYGWYERSFYNRYWHRWFTRWIYSNGSQEIWGGAYGIGIGTAYSASAGTSGNGQNYYPTSGTVQGALTYVYFNAEAAPPPSAFSYHGPPQPGVSTSGGNSRSVSHSITQNDLLSERLNAASGDVSASGSLSTGSASMSSLSKLNPGLSVSFLEDISYHFFSV